MSDRSTDKELREDGRMALERTQNRTDFMDRVATAISELLQLREKHEALQQQMMHREFDIAEQFVDADALALSVERVNIHCSCGAVDACVRCVLLGKLAVYQTSRGKP